MSSKLYNILVPVDFTGKNKWAIAKAIELSNSFHCNVHLVYVRSKRYSFFERNASIENSLKKLEQFRDTYSQQICGEGALEISVLTGNKQKQLADYIQQYEMDLVVTGLSKFNFIHRIASSVSISRLAKKTNIPVLAVRPGGIGLSF
ncbi:MAG: universal stress protein [Bacteroidota bacterium]